MMPKLAALDHPLSCRAPSNSRTQASNGLMVSGYFSGSISRSPRPSGVTQPAQILTRGKTAASSTSTRRPARASRQAVVLPPGPPPTTMTSKPMTLSRATLTVSRPPEGEEKPRLLVQRHAQALDLVGEGHDGEYVSLEVEPPAHVGLGEVVGRGVADQVEEDLGRLEDHRAEGLVGREPHLAPVPDPEDHGSYDVPEELAKDVRGAGRRGMRKEAGHHRWSLSGVVLAGTCSLVKTTGLAAPRSPTNRLHDLLVLEGTSGRPFKYDLTAVDGVEPVGHARGGHEIRLRDEERHPHGLDALGRLDEAAHHHGGESLEGLVEEEDGGAQGEGPRDGHHLLLPAREVETTAGGEAAHLGEELEDTRVYPAPLVRFLGQGLADLEVLRHGEIGEDSRVLRGVADT